MSGREPTREEVVSFLVANEGVTEAQATDFMDVLAMAEDEEAGSSAEMMAQVRERMHTVKLTALVTQIAAMDPGKATMAQVEAIKRIAARTVAETE